MSTVLDMPITSKNRKTLIATWAPILLEPMFIYRDIVAGLALARAIVTW